MFNEREFIASIDRMSPAQFAGALNSLNKEQESTLRVHFGDAEFRTMRELAGRASRTRSPGAMRGNVVVLHGIMGGELSETGSKIWVNVLQLILGKFDHLSLSDAGLSVRSVDATGILKKYYGNQVLSLQAAGFNTAAFWYDWRMDIRRSADRLADFIRQTFPSGPVHLVAHSMGGLVSRAFIKRRPDIWNRCAPGQLVMLGTPNHGSFAIPKLYSGLNSMIRTLAAVDPFHNTAGYLQVAKTFVGSFQMLPSPLVIRQAAALYDPALYSCKPERSRFDDATQFHTELSDVIQPDRMLYVAGYDHVTEIGIKDFSRLQSQDAYILSKDGDGTVPHVLGSLKDVPIFFVNEEHSALPRNADVLSALPELLEKRTAPANLLARKLPEQRGGPQSQEALLEQKRSQEAELDLETQQLAVAVQRSRSAPDLVTPEEERIADLLLRDFVSTPRKKGTAAATVPSRPRSAKTSHPGPPTTIKVRVRATDIDDLAAYEVTKTEALPAVDVISVGHYIGVDPQRAELAIDRLISNHKRAGKRTEEALPLLLTDFTRRGTLRGDLGQIFLVPGAKDREYDIAVAGMGSVGRFGVPELTVLSTELLWTLGRMNKKHLATVLIGGGDNNLSVQEAVAGWCRGIEYSVLESGGTSVIALTFVERDKARAEEILRCLYEAKRRLVDQPVDLDIQDPEPTGSHSARGLAPDNAEVRITAELHDQTYRFGALTNEASVPERDVILNPDLMRDVNDQLPGESDSKRQAELGQFMLRLIFPRDFQQVLRSNAPVVLACDTNVAQIHWEMMAQPSPLATPNSSESFLGLTRGFTRQLRTTFAMPPESPAPRSKTLRVLVVADPADDAPLPGAQSEGQAIAQLFRDSVPALRTKGVLVEVVELIGPEEARCSRVLELLMRSPGFDVFHYAGHCFYSKDAPAQSGFVFSGGMILRSYELTRVDRMPRFVFSNACESGVTPSRAENRSPELAPSFAEAFFSSGVSNFVCTAWPVGDEPARRFAVRLYQELIGNSTAPKAGTATTAAAGAAAQMAPALNPQPMHVAMMRARQEIKDSEEGARTWGAYQHYGNPHFRLVKR